MAIDGLQRCVSLAQMVYDSASVGEGTVKQRQRDRLLQNLQRHFELLKGKKMAEAVAKMDAMLLQAATELAQVAPLFSERVNF